MTTQTNMAAGQESLGEKSDWFTVLAPEALSHATRTSQKFLTKKAKGILIHVRTDDEVNTATFTPKILVPGGDTTVADITLFTFTAISASGNNLLVVEPNGAADMGTENLAGTLPREWKFELTFGGADTTHQMDTEVYARYI